MFGTSRVHGNVGYKQGTWQCRVQAGYMAMNGTTSVHGNVGYNQATW